MTKPKRDHGTFTLDSPADGVLLAQLWENAAKNPKKPGEAFGRIPATRMRNGKTEPGFKVFHVDLNNNRMTITEEWAGSETARRTTALNEVGELFEKHAEDRAVSLPDPGPTTTTFYRLPFRAAELSPDDELRDWAKERADEEVQLLSVLPRRIRLFGEGFQEVATLPRPFGADLAPGTGSTVRALQGRHGVERCIVEGWFASGDGRGTAWILEVGPPADGQQWWLTMRAFDRRPGNIGIWTSAWFNSAGSGTASLQQTLRPVLDPPSGASAIALGTPVSPPQAEVAMCFGTLPPADLPPTTAEEVALRIGRECEATLHTEPPEGARVTLFRGSAWETWLLKGDFPMGLDDMIRAISARGETPTSLALVRMGVIPCEGDPYRALVTEGEAQGRRVTRGMLIRYGPDGTVLGHRLVGRIHEPPGHNGWIGIAPITDMSLFVLGAGEA